MSLRNSLPINWAENAGNDLEGIADYLLAEGEAFEAVEAFLKRIFTAPEHLSTLPGAGKPGRVPGTREWRVKDTPYALIYAVRDDGVYILRVMHDSRQFPEEQ